MNMHRGLLQRTRRGTNNWGVHDQSLAAILLTFCLVSATLAQDKGWPREKSNTGGSLIYYQPQLDEWKDYRQLTARMAVSVRPKTGQPTVGVVYLQARTDANLETRNVVLSHLEIVESKFPSLDQAGAESMDQLVKTFLSPAAIINISLDRLLADLELNHQPAVPPRPSKTIRQKYSSLMAVRFCC